MGRLDEALSEIMKARDLDPASLIINTDVGHMLYLSRRYDEAIARYLKVLETDGSFIMAHWRLAEAYAQKRLFAESIAECQKAISLDTGRFPLNAGALGYCYAIAGQKDEALRMLEAIRPLAASRHSGFDVGLIYAGLNWKDLAFESLQRTITDHDGRAALLRVEPMFDNIRSDPRYIDLLRQMNLQS
jgi:tetratricopeptide (TPR) repeat protein